VTLHSYCRPEDLGILSMAKDFSAYASYRPIISSKERLLSVAREPDANVTVAVFQDRFIVGLAVLQYPDPSERWHRVGERVMMEVSVVEVSRPWRFRGISSGMLGCLAESPIVEDRIFYMVGYSWTWDLAGTGLAAIKYRNMMIRLFSSQGFQTFQTNEPNIMMRPENLFMARIGTGISDPVQRKFKQVRFNMDD